MICNRKKNTMVGYARGYLTRMRRSYGLETAEDAAPIIGTYAACWLTKESAFALYRYYKNRIPNMEPPSKLHITTCYSKIIVDLESRRIPLRLDPPFSYDLFGENKNVLVLRVEHTRLHGLFQEAISAGATYDFNSYKPHITLSTDYTPNTEPPPPPSFPIYVSEYKVEPLKDD